MMDREERDEFESLLEQATQNAASDWEIEFVDSLEEQAENPFWKPTERQWEKLEQIAGRI